INWSLSLFSVDGDAQVLVQSPLSITKAEDRTARIDCHVSGITLSSAYIHWHQWRPDKALEWILYFLSGNPILNQDSEKGKFEADKQLSESTCTLRVKKTKNDAATYYCRHLTGFCSKR
uniref:Ig-like domain-containing protein n=1 Tax=Gopherus evgoodei TaxID=1825980 RepID=A0A8C4W3J1_9SAUR